MIPPPDLLFYFFRVGKFSINLQKFSGGYVPHPPQFSKGFAKSKFFSLKISKFFSGAPPPNPRFFNSFVLDHPDSLIRYDIHMKFLKIIIKFKFFILKMSKFSRGPPIDPQFFSPKSFRVGQK